MKKINFNMNNLVKGVKRTTIRYSPEILIGLGVAGFVSAIVMGIAATPKAMVLIKEEEDRQNMDAEFEDQVVPISKKDCVRVAWRCYVPTVVTAVVSTACLVGSSRINYKRNAALAAAYSLSETAFKDYRSKVIETVGTTKEREVRDGLAKDTVEKHNFKGTEQIKTGDGDILFVDSISGQQVWSSVEKIRKAESDLNKDIMCQDYVSLNDFLYQIGMRQTAKFDDLGWNIGNGGRIDIDFGTTSVGDTPCFVLQYRVQPKAGFNSFS